MFQPRKPYCDGPKKQRIDTPESKWKILQNRGEMDWPLMLLYIVTDLILWNGKNWIEEQCGNGLTSISMSWKGTMVSRDFLIQKVIHHFIKVDTFKGNKGEVDPLRLR